ncbi:phage tail protein [Azospirillum sp. ST 5-10]|uniref:phage tail protein n=1 Tax=unclassified Azospirillum TaxID=2630922 RepID=UPI003F4A1F9E
MTKTFRSVLLAATVATGAGLATPAAACSQDSYIGTVCFFANQFCPRGWLPASGQLLAINGNQALYALLGTTYGGDGRSTFGVPDLRGRAPVGYGQGTGLDNINLAQRAGQNQVTLAIPLPQHTHTAKFTSSGGSGGTISGTVDIPLEGSVSGLPFSTSATLNVVADAKIGSTNTAGRTQNVGNNVLLTSGGSPAPNIYAPAGNGNTTVIGPAGAVTGQATGTVSGTASGGSLVGSAKGDVTLNVTGGSGGGTVTVQPTGVVGAAMTVPTQSPVLALTACIMNNGVFPDRP